MYGREKKFKLYGIFKYLGNNLDELYQERISSLSGDIQAASEDKVRALEKRVRQLKREKEKLLDLGLKNRQDLTPTFENINVEEWVKQYHELNYDLEITETELKVARSTHKELFGGEEEEEAEDSF